MVACPCLGLGGRRWLPQLTRSFFQINHFPGSFQIGRKDRLWRNLAKMQTRCGKRDFNFFPQSFILPQDIRGLRQAWEEGGTRQKWIVKPVRCGAGFSGEHRAAGGAQGLRLGQAAWAWAFVGAGSREFGGDIEASDLVPRHW